MSDSSISAEQIKKAAVGGFPGRLSMLSAPTRTALRIILRIGKDALGITGLPTAQLQCGGARESTATGGGATQAPGF